MIRYPGLIRENALGLFYKDDNGREWDITGIFMDILSSKPSPNDGTSPFLIGRSTINGTSLIVMLI